MEFPLVFLRIWSKGVQKRGLGIGEGLAFNLCMVGPQVDGGVGGESILHTACSLALCEQKTALGGVLGPDCIKTLNSRNL